MAGFDSPWLKWARAVVNAETLESNLNAIALQGQTQLRLGMTHEYDPKRHAIVITAGPAEVPTIFPAALGLLLGDIVHNYRSSLDHLAWTLYKRGRTPNLRKWQEQGIYFPIASDRDQFNGWLSGKRPRLPGVRRADIAIVRRYQPYKVGKRRRDTHILKVLDDLAIADKHRVIQPVQAVPEKATWNILAVADCQITRVVPRGRRFALEPGAELIRFYVKRNGPNPRVDVEPHFTVDPTVDGRFLFEDWGHRTMRYIARLLSEFAQPPESVRDLLRATAHGESPAWL